MRILKLELDYFKSHKSTVLNFSESNFWMIQGQNGAGKSSIFNAVIWVLYGSTSNLKKSKILNKTSKRCRVILTFEKNDKVDEVARHIGNWKTFDQSSAPLMMRKEGTLVTDFHHGKSDKSDRKKEALLLQTEIERIIGLSEKAFSSIISFGQEAKPLSSQSSSDKRAIFEEMLNTDWINTAQQNAKEDFDNQAQKMEAITNTSAHLSIRIEDKTKQLKRDTETLSDFEVRKQSRIQQVEQDIYQATKELERISTTLGTAQERSPIIVLEISDLESSIEELDQKERQLSKSYNLKLEPLQKSIQDFKDKKLILQNADDLVRRHYENTQNTKKQLEDIRESIAQHTTKISQTTQRMDTLKGQIQTHDNALEAENLNLEHTKKDIAHKRSEISRLTTIIAEKSVVIKSLTTELEKESTSWTCPREGCGRTLEPDQEKLSEIQAKIEEETGGIKTYRVTLKLVQTHLADLESTYKKRVESISEKEKRKSETDTRLKILSRDLQKLNTAKKDVEKQEVELSNKLTNLQVQNPESANQLELKGLTEQIQQSTEKLEELQTNFNTTRDGLVLRVKSLATKLQAFRTELGILDNTVKVTAKQEKDALLRISKLEKHLAQEKQTVCTITQKDIDHLKADLADLEKKQFYQRLDISW